MSDKISRRNFIKTSAVGIVAGSAALSAIDIRKLFANSPKASVTKSGDDIIVKLADAKNSALATVGGSVMINDENILIRTSETQFIAVSLICTHKGCTVELTGDKFVCPCHGSEYSLAGKVTPGSKATKDLRTFETIFETDKNQVVIKMAQ